MDLIHNLGSMRGVRPGRFDIHLPDQYDEQLHAYIGLFYGEQSRGFEEYLNTQV